MSCVFCRPSENIPHICPMCKGEKKTSELKYDNVCKCDGFVKVVSIRQMRITCSECSLPIKQEFKNCSLCNGEGAVWEKRKY